MYFKDFYAGLSEEETEARIREEGFDPMKYHNNPGDVYALHQHPETKLLAFLEGTMEAKVGEETFSCSKGDKLIIPGGVPHSAVVGKDGCIFFWSEKII